MFNPVLFLWEALLCDVKARFQRIQDSGEGNSNEEEGQGRRPAEVKALLAPREKLWWEGVLSCYKSLRQ